MEEPKIISKRAALFLLLAFIVIAGYLRIANLDKYSFWTDEFFHVFSAKSLLETGTPLLPSGVPYARSVIYTYIVSMFFKLFGVNEVTARIPSVIFGILMVPLTYYAVSRFLNRNVGVISAFLVGFGPLFILWSKQCRMYTLFQSLYLFSTFYFFRAFEGKRQNDKVIFTKSNIRHYIAFLLIYLVSLSVHKLSIFFVPTVFIYCLIMSASKFLENGLIPALHSKYFKVTILIAILGLSIFFFNILRLKSIFYDCAKTLPGWHNEAAHDINFYRWIIQNTYPVFSYLFPLALLILIFEKSRTGLYIGCCFLVPFFALSLIFSDKSLRYILFILPFFLVTISFLIEKTLYYCWKSSNKLSPHFISSGFLKNKAVFIICFFAFIFTLYPVLFPWVRMNPNKFADFGLYDFKNFGNFIKEIDKDDIVICTEPFLIEYYSSRKPDFIILTYWYKTAANRLPLKNKKGEEIDFNSGMTAIKNLDQLASVEKSKKKTWIITNNWFLRNNLVDQDMIDYIKRTYNTHPFSQGLFKVYYK